MQLIRVSVLTRILKTEVIESIPGKKSWESKLKMWSLIQKTWQLQLKYYFFMNYFKILVRTLTLHLCVIPAVNQDVSIFIKKIK